MFDIRDNTVVLASNGWPVHVTGAGVMVAETPSGVRRRVKDPDMAAYQRARLRLLLKTVTADDLREARRRLGLSQARLAAELGLSENGIYRMECGNRPVERRTALAVFFLEAVGPLLDNHD